LLNAAGECEPADVGDPTAAFGGSNELGRAEQSALGMLPADERLGATDRPGCEVHLRLVVDDQLAVADRVVKLGDDSESAWVGTVVPGLVEGDLAVVVLRGPERDSGMAYEGVEVAVHRDRRGSCERSSKVTAPDGRVVIIENDST
jgi:hypothetical protein